MIPTAEMNHAHVFHGSTASTSYNHPGTITDEGTSSEHYMNDGVVAACMQGLEYDGVNENPCYHNWDTFTWMTKFNEPGWLRI